MTKLSESDQIVILCGGKGTRLRSEIGESQKTMAIFRGRPFLDLLIDYGYRQGCRRFVLCAGYQAGQIERHYKEAFPDLEICVSTEQEPLGTGGAVKHAQSVIDADPFFVMNGDCFCAADLVALKKFHESYRASVSLLVCPSDEKNQYGNITLDGDNQIVRFVEKEAPSSTGFVNSGIYCFSRHVFSAMPPGPFSLETQFFPNLIHHGLYGLKSDLKFFDIGTPERFYQAQRILAGEEKKNG